MFRRRKRDIPGLNTTSTADISFMLLIFFLVTSSMDTDKGLPRQLPPPDDSTRQEEVEIKQRNVLELELDGNDRLTCNGEDIDAKELTLRVKEFVSNKTNDPSLPEMSQREVHLMGQCLVSDHHIISIKTDRQASYNAYFELQNAIVRGYNTLRNELARSRFGHSLSACTSEERAAIELVYPQRISEDLTYGEEGGEP